MHGPSIKLVTVDSMVSVDVIAAREMGGDREGDVTEVLNPSNVLGPRLDVVGVTEVQRLPVGLRGTVSTLVGDITTEEVDVLLIIPVEVWRTLAASDDDWPMVAPEGKTVVLAGTDDVMLWMTVLPSTIAVSNKVVMVKVGSIQPRTPLCTLVMRSERLAPLETTAWLQVSVDWPAQRL